jgi:hypothetical protein
MADSINDIVKLTRRSFPNARVLFATNGTLVRGNPAEDDPQPIPFAHEPDRPQDRARQAALEQMRTLTAGQARKPP